MLNYQLFYMKIFNFYKKRTRLCYWYFFLTTNIILLLILEYFFKSFALLILSVFFIGVCIFQLITLSECNQNKIKYSNRWNKTIFFINRFMASFFVIVAFIFLFDIFDILSMSYEQYVELNKYVEPGKLVDLKNWWWQSKETLIGQRILFITRCCLSVYFVRISYILPLLYITSHIENDIMYYVLGINNVVTSYQYFLSLFN